MNKQIYKNGADLEDRMYEAFSAQGWDCKKANADKAPDITLSKNGHVYGYVECYYVKKDIPLSKKRVEQILYELDILKPEIFILTNGVYFEVYYDGIFFGKMTIPISYSGFMQNKRLLTYSKKIKEMANKNDGK